MKLTNPWGRDCQVPHGLRRLLALATLAGLIGWAPALARGQGIMAYHAHWMGETWRQYDLGKFSRIMFFDLVVGRDGAIAERHGWPEQWLELRRAAKGRVEVTPVLTILGKESFVAVFGDAQARARLLDACLAIAEEARGLHLDVEVFDSVDTAHLEAFRGFLADLRKALGPRGERQHLGVFVPSSGDLYGAQELAYFDEVVAQGYDAHWAEATITGPVALLDGDSPAAWKPTAKRLRELGVPRESLYISSPLYGYEWPAATDRGGALTSGKAAIITMAPVSADQLGDIRTNALTRVAQFGLRRDPASQAPWYAFRDGAQWRQGWFDDAESLRRRLAFVRDEGLGGVAFFVLGYDGGALVEVARQAFRAKTAPANGASPAPDP